MSRFLIRSILIAALIISIGAIVAAFWFLGPRDASTWATVAAALAVVTSVISSWTSQRSLELQQDAQKPYPYPTVDVESRYNLVQLRITNYGGSAAYDISLKWNKPLINSSGTVIRFTQQDKAPEIPILLPSESMSTLIDGGMQLFQKYQDMNYSGYVEFKDASGKHHKHRFHLSIEKYRGTLTFSVEDPKTHRELQRIPQEIQRLTGELRAIRSTLQTNYANEDQQDQQIQQPDETTPTISEVKALLAGIIDRQPMEPNEIPTTHEKPKREEPKADNDLEASSTETQPQQ